MSMLHPHICLKTTMLYICALTLSSRSFHHVLGLWCYIMWYVMWRKEKQKEKQNPYKIRKIKEKKIKLLVSKASHNKGFMYQIIGKSWTSGHKTSRVTIYNGINQEELLVASNQEWCKELYSRMLQMLTKQNTTHEKGKRITFLGNAKRTITRD